MTSCAITILTLRLDVDFHMLGGFYHVLSMGPSQQDDEWIWILFGTQMDAGQRFGHVVSPINNPKSTIDG